MQKFAPLLRVKSVILFDFFAFSLQLENPGSYDNLENYYNKFRVCKRKNNWLHSPQNILGVEDLPFLKVSLVMVFI